MYDVGDFLSIIPYLIMKKRNKNTSKMELYITNSEYSIESSKNSIELNYDIEEKKIEICTLFKNFLIFTLVDFTAQIGPVIYYIIKEEQKLEVKQANLNSSLIFSILAVIIFSRFILHITFHRHHVFSFIINLFCLIILAVFDIKKIYDDHGDNIVMSIIYIFIKIFSNILYSLENVFAKYIFLYNYISPYTLLLTKSIYHFVYLTIFSFPFIFVKLKDEKGEPESVFSMIVSIFDEKKYILIVIGYIINSFFYNISNFLIIDIFSPNHLVISRIFENFGIFLTNLVMNGTDSEDILFIRIIMYILLILSSFIFNEFIIINICGLSKSTALFLDYEAKNEISFRNDSEDSANSSIIKNKSEGFSELELENFA